jgi:MFS family permease
MAGVFLAGFCFSAFFTFYPAYGAGQGIETAVLPMLGVAVMSGAAILQPILGRMAQRRGAPVILVGLTIIATLAALLLATGVVEGLLLYLVIAIWGAGALTTYPIFSGFAYQRLKAIPTFDIARMVLISYGVAEIISPSIIAQVIDRFGPHGLFGGMAAATFVLVAAALFDTLRNR